MISLGRTQAGLILAWLEGLGLANGYIKLGRTLAALVPSGGLEAGWGVGHPSVNRGGVAWPCYRWPLRTRGLAVLSPFGLMLCECRGVGKDSARCVDDLLSFCGLGMMASVGVA